MLMEVKYHQDYLEFQDTYGHNFNSYTPCFLGPAVQCVVDDVIRKRIIPELDMTATQTGSKHIGQLETKFQRLRPYFWCRPV